MALEIQVLARDGHKNGKGVNWVIGMDTPLCISNDNTNINKH